MKTNSTVEIIHHKLSFVEEKNACITVWKKDGKFPCILTDKREIIPFSVQHRENNNIDYNQSKEEEYIPSDVIYGGMLCRHWGHFIVNASIHLWYAIEHWKENDLPIVFSTPEKPERRFLDFLKLTGIPYKRFIFITKPTRFKSVIVPEPSFIIKNNGTAIAPEFKIPFNAVKDKAQPSRYTKIYLSRRKFTTPNSPLPHGEKIFEKIFKTNGYKIIYPEKITLQQQINLFSNAETVVTTNGTLAHNVVLMNDNKRLVILNRTADRSIESLQNALNCIRNTECYQVDAFYAPLPVCHVNGPFYFHLTPEMSMLLSSLKIKFPIQHKEENLFDSFFNDWGKIYGNKESTAYSNLISLVGKTTENAKLVSQLADCFISPNKYKKFLYKLLYEISFGRIKSFFRFKWKGNEFNPTKENIKYRKLLKEKSQNTIKSLP